MVESMVDQELGQAETRFHPHTSHWGVFSARMTGDELEGRPHPGDPDPNDIIRNFPAAHRARVAEPMVRKGWLENGPGPDSRRGRDEFVPVTWERALDLLGKEIARIRDGAGPGAIFGGSYGWSSAGRSTTPRARSTAFSTSPVAAMSGRGLAIRPAPRRF